MIVLYGGDNSTPGGISGIVEVDTDAATVVETTDTVTRTIVVTDADEPSVFTFTSVPKKRLTDVKISFKVNIPGADSAEVDSASYERKDATLGTPTKIGVPMPKDELFALVNSFETSFSRTTSQLSVIVDGEGITCPVDYDDTSTSANTAEISLTHVAGDEFSLDVVLDDQKFSGTADFSYIDKIKVKLAVTVGTVTESTPELTMDISTLVFRPKIVDHTQLFLYSITGEYHMAGGWTTNNVLDMAKHKVFKQDNDPIKSCFRNKLYGTVDPVAFNGGLLKFLPTAGKIGKNFTYLNTISNTSPWPFAQVGSSTYVAKDTGGAVDFEVVAGEMTVDTEAADAPSGYAVFSFAFTDSVYTTQFLYMPCVIDNAIPKAVLFDGKIAYDRFAVMSEITATTLPTLASAWSFFTFFISYQASMASAVLARILNYLPFMIYTRGLGCALLDNSIAVVYQIMVLEEHTKFVNQIGSGFSNQFANFFRGTGYVMSKSLRGLTKAQQAAVMEEYVLALDDELNRGFAKHGNLIMSFCGAPIIMPFQYSDGFHMKPPAIGAFYDTDINKLYEDDNLPDDEFRAAVRKHTVFSYQYSQLSMMVKAHGWYAFPAFNGTLTRVVKDGKINEIGGVDDDTFRIARNWQDTPISSTRSTLAEEVAYIMTRASGDRFSRMVMDVSNDLENGVPFGELPAKPSPMGGGQDATFGIGAMKAKIIHLDLSAGTIQEWSRSKHGEVEDVRIIRPNGNLIIAV